MTRILIADDNAINRKLLAWQLETLGFPSEDATCGKDAIAACAERSFDIIFMDVNLGDMDGYTVTRTVRDKERDGRTPIVAVTAHVGREERERCLASGMDDFLSKPITLSPLAQLLVRWGVNGYDAAAARAQLSGDTVSGPWLLQIAIDWLRALEQGSAHAGLAREIASDFLARAPAHASRLRAAVGDGDGALYARMCFALHRNCVGIGAFRLAAAIGESLELASRDAATVDQWLSDIDRILVDTSAEVQREFM